MQFFVIVNVTTNDDVTTNYVGLHYSNELAWVIIEILEDKA